MRVYWPERAQNSTGRRRRRKRKEKAARVRRYRGPKPEQNFGQK